MKDCCCGEGEDREEHTCKEIGDENNNDNWENWRVNFILEGLSVHDDKIANPPAHYHDDSFSDEHKHGADG